MKRHFCILFLGTVVLAEDPSPIVLYSNFQWMVEQNDLDKQINLTVHTNRFRALSNLVQLAREVHSAEFREAATSNKMVGGGILFDPDYKVYAFTNYNCLSLSFRVPTNDLSEDSLRAFSRRVRHYVDLRSDGMSPAYGLASLRVSKEFVKGLEPGSPEERIKERYWIPNEWIRKSISAERAIFVVDEKFAMKYYEYGPSYRYDAKEFDPKLAPIIAKAQIEAMKEALARARFPGDISNKDMWDAAQRNLRLHQGINWASPSDLNSLRWLVFVQTNNWWITNR